MRWDEEVQLLQEEMRRVRAFLTWQASWWIEQEDLRRDTVNPVHQEGISAYARRQAHLRLALNAHFEHLWRFVDNWVCMGDVPADREDSDGEQSQDEGVHEV